MDRANLLHVMAGIAALALAGMAATPARAADKPSHRELRWDDLMPKGWNPFEEMRKTNPGMEDDSPRGMQAMRDLWDNAPPVPSLDKAAVKLPGYVVPLEATQGALKEFLLVPYFGACIHSPPPPANQIVHVVMANAAKGVKSMDVVWVSGTMRVRRLDSFMGVAGYGLEATAIEPYVPPTRK